MSMALHPSAVLITAASGRLTAWDLLAGGERLRVVQLQDPNLPGAALAQAAGEHTSHVSLVGALLGTRALLSRLAGWSSSPFFLLSPVGDTVICELGALVKVVHIPFPSLRSKSKRA